MANNPLFRSNEENPMPVVPLIPVEAVEAAAKVMYELHYGPTGWDGLPDRPRMKYIDEAMAILEAAAPHIYSASTAAMATTIREHWPAEVAHPMYPTYVQCMKHGCEWDGRFLGDISEHVAELIASEKP